MIPFCWKVCYWVTIVKLKEQLRTGILYYVYILYIHACFGLLPSLYQVFCTTAGASLKNAAFKKKKNIVLLNNPLIFLN